MLLTLAVLFALNITFFQIQKFYVDLWTISLNYYCKLTSNLDGNGSTITSNRISYSTCVCSTITCSNTINGVVSTEHCTSTSIIHCSDTSGL